MHPLPRDDRVVRFGRVHRRYRGEEVFGIRQADRRCHMYIIGKTGTGKSTLIETIIRQDIATSGQGCMLIDPHGDLVERVVAAVPGSRREDLIYFNVPDTSASMGFNPLIAGASERRHLTASFVLDGFKKLWPEFWGPRLEHILRNALLALVEHQGATLADVLRLLDEPTFRRTVASRCINPAVRRFWLREYESYPARLRAEAIAPIQNKVGAFLANPVLRPIITQPWSSFDLRQVMDEGRILLVNLARGKIGDDACALLGSLLVSSVGLAALSRANVPEQERRDFFVFLDEFQTFTTRAVAGMLAELRKYRVGLVLAHQHLAQLEPEIRAAVLGNVGTLVCFRVGPEDGEILAPYIGPDITPHDLVSTEHVCVRMLNGGVLSTAFQAARHDRKA